MSSVTLDPTVEAATLKLLCARHGIDKKAIEKCHREATRMVERFRGEAAGEAAAKERRERLMSQRTVTVIVPNECWGSYREMEVSPAEITQASEKVHFITVPNADKLVVVGKKTSELTVQCTLGGEDLTFEVSAPVSEGSVVHAPEDNIPYPTIDKIKYSNFFWCSSMPSVGQHHRVAFKDDQHIHLGNCRIKLWE